MPSFRSGQQVAEIEMASVLLGVPKRKLIDHLDQAVLAKAPAIKMLISDWHVDELGIQTREITARD